MGRSEAEGNVSVRRVLPGTTALLLGERAWLHRRGGAVVSGCGGDRERLRHWRRLLLRRRQDAEGKSRRGGRHHDGTGRIRADVGGGI